MRRHMGGGGGSGVWLENAAIVQAFLAVSTQWRTASTGFGFSLVGLDYAAVAAAFTGRGIAAGPEIWEGIAVMEHAAMSVFNTQK